LRKGPLNGTVKKVSVASEYITGKHIADVLTKVTGKTHILRTLTDDDINDFSFLDNDELKQMFKWIKDYGLFGRDDDVKDISAAKKLHPKIRSFEQYAVEAYGKS